MVPLKSLALKAESQDKKSLDNVELDYEVDCTDENLSRAEKAILSILEELKSLSSSRLIFTLKRRGTLKGEDRSEITCRTFAPRVMLESLEKKEGVYEIVEQ